MTSNATLMYTPESALAAARAIIEDTRTTIQPRDYDPEDGHKKLDALMCDILEQHGYGDLVALFDASEKWYS